MESLDQIAVELKADKGSKGHNYAVHYEKFFGHLRHEPITLLELGVSYGKSMVLWERYFTKAKIYGVDIKAFCKQSETERVKIFVGNAANKKFLEKIIEEIGPPDIVIDDSSHRSDEQQASIRCLYPHVKQGGLYIIEDLNMSYFMGGAFRRSGTTIEFAKDLIDCMHYQDFDPNIALGNRLTKGHNIKTDEIFDGKIAEYHFYPRMLILVKG